MPAFNRRALIGIGMAVMAKQANAAQLRKRFELAAAVLQKAVDSGQVRAAAMSVREGADRFEMTFGKAKSSHATFLLGSISKPLSIAALMTLFDHGQFQLTDPVEKFIPEFTGGMRAKVTIQHLLTHVSGLPDQLPNNADLRKSHAPLSKFMEGAVQVPLAFEPASRYGYSSMGILLAAEIAQRISGENIQQLVQETILSRLEMRDSALGMGDLLAENVMEGQVEFGAVESGAGSPEAKSWDWNSSYWRHLGAPWGGAHASAADIARFLEEFMHPSQRILTAEVAKLMVRNHNPPGFESRGLGFDVGLKQSCFACSDETFGHTGSTGTLAWADPKHDRVCVVLTTLPAEAVPADQHPRQLASNSISG